MEFPFDQKTVPFVQLERGVSAPISGDNACGPSDPPTLIIQVDSVGGPPLPTPGRQYCHPDRGPFNWYLLFLEGTWNGPLKGELRAFFFSRESERSLNFITTS